MTQCGTPLYMSPEQCKGQAYSRSADVWAVGCVLFEMMAREPPWMAQMGPGAAAGGIRGLMHRISTGKLDTAPLRRHYSKRLCELLDALTEKK